MISLDTGLWRGQPAASTFNPLSLLPEFWVDSSDASTIYQDSGLTTLAAADGDPVGGWKDKSGNARHATQSSGANKPLFKISIQNGKNVVRFNGTSAVLNTASFGYAALTRWAFFVFKTTITDRRSVWSHSASDATDLFIFGNSSTAVYSDIGNAVGPYSQPSVTFASGYYLLGCVWTRPAGSSILTFYKNGSSSTPTVNSATLVPNTTAQLLNVGRGYSFGSQFHDSDICELIYGTSTLSAQNISDLTSYLNTKWGVY